MSGAGLGGAAGALADLEMAARRNPGGREARLVDEMRENRRKAWTNMGKDTGAGAIAAVGKEHDDVIAPALARLAAIDEEGRALYELDHGLGTWDSAPSKSLPLGLAQEREALSRRVAAAGAIVRQRASEAVQATARALEAARLAPGDDSQRMADLMEADQLSRTAPAERLASEAGKLAAAGDARGASIRLRALQMHPEGLPARTAQERVRAANAMRDLAAAVESALDEAVPVRRRALEEHQAATAAFTDLLTRVNTAEMQAAQAVGDSRAAAVASIGAKLAGRQAAATARQVG